MPVKLSLSPDHDGEWRVSLDDTVIVCFSGPSAHEQALRRSRELADLLRSIAEECEPEGHGPWAEIPTPG
ncbi:MAG: hypothetical protein AB7H96_00750 [Vicinamibacterales bacterium]